MSTLLTSIDRESVLGNVAGLRAMHGLKELAVARNEDHGSPVTGER